jgi:hypothetical protein
MRRPRTRPRLHSLRKAGRCATKLSRQVLGSPALRGVAGARLRRTEAGCATASTFLPDGASLNCRTKHVPTGPSAHRMCRLWLVRKPGVRDSVAARMRARCTFRRLGAAVIPPVLGGGKRKHEVGERHDPDAWQGVPERCDRSAHTASLGRTTILMETPNPELAERGRRQLPIVDTSLQPAGSRGPIHVLA